MRFNGNEVQIENSDDKNIKTWQIIAFFLCNILIGTMVFIISFLYRFVLSISWFKIEINSFAK